MRSKAALVAALATAGLAVGPTAMAGATPPTADRAPTAAAQQKMSIVDFRFAQPTADLTVGDTMTWTNDDKAPHDVKTTKSPTKLQSPILSTGQSWKHRFTVAGRYDYICSLHPQMSAVLTVAAAATNPAAAKVTRAAAQAPAATKKASPAKTGQVKAGATKTAAAKARAADAAKESSSSADSTAATAKAPAQVAPEGQVPAAASVEEAAAEPATAEAGAAAAARAEEELVAFSATGRRLADIRQYGAALVAILLCSLLVVGMQGRPGRAAAMAGGEGSRGHDLPPWLADSRHRR